MALQGDNRLIKGHTHKIQVIKKTSNITFNEVNTRHLLNYNNKEGQKAKRGHT